MAQIVQYLQDTVEEVRRLYYALSPGDLEDLGLTTALKNVVEDFQELYINMNWQMETADIDNLFPLPVQTMIYRIMQEALTNIGKHAYPKNVKINIEKKERQVNFLIQDDGRGFAMDDVLEGDKRGMGLAAMAQRVSLADGLFDIWSRENQGVRIVFSIPFSSPGENV
jgi:two-component system sensor histidine kinase DegS